MASQASPSPCHLIILNGDQHDRTGQEVIAGDTTARSCKVRTVLVWLYGLDGWTLPSTPVPAQR